MDVGRNVSADRLLLAETMLAQLTLALTNLQNEFQSGASSERGTRSINRIKKAASEAI